MDGASPGTVAESMGATPLPSVQRQSLPAFRVVGIPLRTSNAEHEAIGSHWGRFYAERVMRSLVHRVGDEVFAVYTEYEGDHTKPYTLVLGAKVTPGTPAPPGMVYVDMPAQTYTSVVAEGAMPAALIDAWSRIWKMPLRRAYTTDFEIHGRDPSKVPIFISVRDF